MTQVRQTGKADEMIRWLREIKVSRGGDCEEYALSGLEQGKYGDNALKQGKYGDNALEQSKYGGNALEQGKYGGNALEQGKYGGNALEQGKYSGNALEQSKYGSNALSEKRGSRTLLQTHKYISLSSSNPAYSSEFLNLIRYLSLGRSSWLQVYLFILESIKDRLYFLQPCPACLVRLYWMVCEMGGKWLYSCCFVGGWFLFDFTRKRSDFNMIDNPRLAVPRLLDVYVVITFSGWNIAAEIC